MARNGCRMRKAEINQIISFDSRRLADINTQLNQLKSHGTRPPHKPSVSPEQQAKAPAPSGYRKPPASIRIQASNLRGGFARKIARFLRTRST